MSDNDTQQQDELCALEAIYGPDCCVNHAQRTCQVFLPSASAQPHLTLRAALPAGYPASVPPLLELEGPHLAPDRLAWALAQLEQLFAPGEVVLYSCAEWLRDQADLWRVPDPPRAAAPPPAQDSDATLALALQQAELQSAAAGPVDAARAAEVAAAAAKTVHGEPELEKKSTFQAHLAPVHNREEVDAVMAALLQHNKIRNATHNIMAYRIHDEVKDTFLQDHDDDGESAAGGRLLHLLQVMDARNVVVVVSRWYGGVLMGPARFTAINNAARRLLEAHGHGRPAAGEQGASAIKRKKKP